MKYLITGGSGGLGKALCQELYSDNEITTLGREDCDINCDLAKMDCSLSGLNPDIVIHCAGFNYIAPHNELLMDDILHIIRVNALSQFQLNRHFLNQASIPSQFIHVISDAAWTPMTHSLAYNVSKAAQLMVMRQMAHEDKRSIIYGVSPGKIANTGMSTYIDTTFPAMRGMTYDEGREYQLSRLKTGELQPETVAKFIVALIVVANKSYHGHNFCIGG